MHVLILCFLTAFTLTYCAIPSIIHIAKIKNLCDEPVERSSHTTSTPSLGGIGIFSGAIFSIILWTPFGQFSNLQYILCALIILFLIGAKDDILPMSAYSKIVAQLLAAAILVFKSNIQLMSMYGILGFDQPLPVWLSVLLSVFTILVIINAFNLLDGINGLAGSIAALVVGTLGCWFYVIGRIELAIVAFATVGAVVAFLKYNFTPARIFMGDTGSLFVGLVSAVLIIQFIELNSNLSPDDPYKFRNVPAVAIGIMIIPLFDTMRVFVTRIFRGFSPFHPDRRHIHHLLIDYGMSHMRATGLLVFINVMFITGVFSLHKSVGLHVLLLLVMGIASILTYWLHNTVMRKKQVQAGEEITSEMLQQF